MLSASAPYTSCNTQQGQATVAAKLALLPAAEQALQLQHAVVLDLGFIDYSKAYEVQKQILAEVRFGNRPDTIILAEHPSIFTIGRTGRRDNILVDEQILIKEGITVHQVDRGGDVTYHGPGQLLIYPIVDLKRINLKIHSFLRRLEELAIGFLQVYGVLGERKNGQTGIWVQDKKIASVGIGVSRCVSYHGLAININPNLRYFSMINPCGIPGLEVTSLARVLDSKINVEEAKNSLFDLFGAKLRTGGGGYDD